MKVTPIHPILLVLSWIVVSWFSCVVGYYSRGTMFETYIKSGEVEIGTELYSCKKVKDD